MPKSKIEWCDYTWNPVTGCTKVSAGCQNCYAERHANRFWGDRKFSDVQFHKDRLEKPEKITEPSLIFVNSMSDLFHPALQHFEGDYFDVRSVFYEMKKVTRHTFLILTKRPELMMKFCEYHKQDEIWFNRYITDIENVWVGVSIEDQKTADQRIPLLLKSPFKNKFISYEPALSPVDLSPYLYVDIPGKPRLNQLKWVIAGGESGPNARPCHPDWVRDLLVQCLTADVPFLFKQWGEWVDVHPDRPAYEFSKPLSMCAKIGDTRFYKVGKKAAGRLVDGVLWDQYPEALQKFRPVAA